MEMSLDYVPSVEECEALIWHFRWPEEPVCDMEMCPKKLDGGYCIECHGYAYGAMNRARFLLASGLFRFLNLRSE